MFQSIGERLNKFASVVIRRAKCYLRCNTTEATEMNLMFATGMLSSIIITTGKKKDEYCSVMLYQNLCY